MFRFLRNRYQDGQVFETSLDCADQCHATATVIKIKDGQVQFASSTADDLHRCAHASRGENHGLAAPKGFTQHWIEVMIARVEKNKPWFHEILGQHLVSTSRRLRQSKGLQCLRRKTPVYIQIFRDLVLRDCVARGRPVDPVDWTVIKSELG